MIKEISLIGGGVALVDDADYDTLSCFKWRVFSMRFTKIRYAYRAGGRAVAMHRVIMQPPPGMVVDHINGNGLDNRRANLRLCTQSENLHNSKLRKNNTTGYRGVSRYNGKFAAEIFCNKVRYWLGVFNTAEEAARAYDRKAREHFRDFARTNFPEEDLADILSNFGD